MAIVTESKALLDYVIVKDIRTQSTDAGTFLAGSWVVRTLNTIKRSSPSIASLSSNQLLLARGLWEVFITASAYQVGRHQLRLWNVEDSIEVLGTSERANASDIQTNRTFLIDIFEIQAPRHFEIQHQCSDTRNVDGLGDSAQFAQEVYTMGLFKRLRT